MKFLYTFLLVVAILAANVCAETDDYVMPRMKRQWGYGYGGWGGGWGGRGWGGGWNRGWGGGWGRRGWGWGR
ncbi:hypothetical protein QR680_011599 [Steinernema hermaphroditum]|uniref:Uncharacterized protein n=1 Tax=Steinernema hermaphroditum TaxID=289476 RepID=A0AA39HZ18_9BILA|nr:hypothetical protein QR680_011599 [Steinernema hermaphroditum]